MRPKVSGKVPDPISSKERRETPSVPRATRLEPPLMNPNQRITRSAILAGTAVAIIFGGAVFGGSLELTRSQPAFADAVQVEGPAPTSFADVVDHVRPAVVSVRVQSVANASATSPDNFFD